MFQPGLERGEIRLRIAHRHAERDSAQPEQGGLFGGSQCAGMPARVAEIQPKIYPFPVMRAKGNAICRRFVARDRVGNRRSVCGDKRNGGRECVMACPIEDSSTSGATIRTSPKCAAAFASAAMPGL